jgi:hypothetical protein
LRRKIGSLTFTLKNQAISATTIFLDRVKFLLTTLSGAFKNDAAGAARCVPARGQDHRDACPF